MKNSHAINQTDLIERLIALEYAIRQSMTMREDQDEPASHHHKEAAETYGIVVEVAVTKGDLLNAVQTLVRAKQKESIHRGT